MQVNVFISETREGHPPMLLVLPYGPEAAIPSHLQGVEWRNLAVASTSDALLGASTSEVEEAIAEDGYALVNPTG